jgi:glucose-1-phosphate thymidylyltransferase
MWGIIPSAGEGKRIQPLAFSKELLPVGVRESLGSQRPKAVSDFIVDRMILAGAQKLCFIISPLKDDILRYHSSGSGKAHIWYQVQPRALGLCDAVFRPVPLIQDREDVLIGLPDTIWFPIHGFTSLTPGKFSFLLFPSSHPENFDSVLVADESRVVEIQVKHCQAKSQWIWGAMRMPATIYRALYEFWITRSRKDEYLGTLIQAWIDEGGEVLGIKAGTSYLDVGSVQGLQMAWQSLLGEHENLPSSEQGASGE